MGIDHSEEIKAALLSEYESIRSEIVLRIQSQNGTLGWLVALSGSFIAALVAVRFGDSEASILASLHKEISASLLMVLAVLFLSYAIGVELLLSFWIYQLFQIFHLHRMTHNIECRYKSYLEIDSGNYDLFQWDEENFLHGTKGQNVFAIPVSLIVRITQRLQPLTLYLLAVISIAGVVWIVIYDTNTKRLLPDSYVLFFSIATCILVLALPAMYSLQQGLHIWVESVKKPSALRSFPPKSAAPESQEGEENPK